MAAAHVVSPVTGDIVSLDAVPDPVFSQRVLGDGVAIVPAAGAVVAPAAGHVEALFPTGHAIGIRTPDGVDILIHVGVDSSRLEGVFRPRVQLGQQVVCGQLLVEFDLEQLSAQARSNLIPVIITALPPGWQVAVVPPPAARVAAGTDPILILQQGGQRP